MNTEITDKENFNGWVLYDGNCRLCLGMARRFQHLLAGRHFELLPLQTEWVKARLHLPEAQLLSEMRLLKPDGRFFGGAEAVLEISRHFWWAWLPGQIGRIPPVKGVLHAVYRWIARNRDCADGRCEIKKRSRFVDFLPLLTLPVLALLLRAQVAAWVFMWAMAFAFYFGCKWLTYRETLRRGVRPGLFRALAYLFAWPGMAAENFLDGQYPFMNQLCPAVRAERRPQTRFALSRGFAKCGKIRAWFTQGGALTDSRLPWATIVRPGRAFSLRLRLQLEILGDFLRRLMTTAVHGFGVRPYWKSRLLAKPRKAEWVFAVAKMIFGAVIVWAFVRMLFAAHPLLAGWVGMIGIVFILHFGLFHLLLLLWWRAGINATPLMRNPMVSKSLAEFWGRRWNTAYHELAFRFAFRPLRRLTTPATATLLVFGISGLIHELVISLPARGGYGLPTLYFLTQGVGSLFERSRLGRGIGVGRGVRGWLFTFATTVFPAYWLFHPPFIAHVILPMLTAIAAT